MSSIIDLEREPSPAPLNRPEGSCSSSSVSSSTRWRAARPAAVMRGNYILLRRRQPSGQVGELRPGRDGLVRALRQDLDSAGDGDVSIGGPLKARTGFEIGIILLTQQAAIRADAGIQILLRLDHIEDVKLAEEIHFCLRRVAVDQPSKREGPVHHPGALILDADVEDVIL